MRRRALLLSTPLLLLARPAAADLIYVLNSGDSSIQVLDAFTRQELRRIPALREVHHLVMSPDGRDLLIADSGGNEILFVDPATGDVRRRERISNPYHLDFSPDGTHLVVCSLRRNQVDIYRARDLTLLARLRMPDKPSHMAFRPDGKIVYVTLQGSGTVGAVSLETREVLWEVPVGREPAGIVWHRGKLIIGIMGSDHFAVMNPETKEIERQIPIGRGAHTLFVQPDGRALWGTSRVQSRLAEIDPSTLDVRRIIELPGGPDCLAFDPDGRIWATLRWAGRIARVDPRTGEFETIRVGRSPHGIFIQPRRAESWRALRLVAAVALFALPAAAQPAAPSCPAGTVYLTIDTGWGREAERIAEILKRRNVRATLFVAHEPTFTGERSLGPGWAAFWRARVAEGHVFATHTDRHWYFRGDAGPGRTRYVSRTGEGETVLDQAAMCRELAQPIERLRAVAPEAVVLPLWRAPGGITTPGAIRMAEACGLRHQGWSANGFLGDELSSATSPNQALAARTLRSVRDGEVLVMHWGVRSRSDPYVNVLEEVITGLQSRGFCFATLAARGR